MPGFDRTGPSGFGPMTGGGQGFCARRGFHTSRRGSGARFFGGRRGWRDRRWAAGMPGRRRGGVGAPWAFQDAHPYTSRDEPTGLREYAAWLKEELGAVEERLGKPEVSSVKEEK
jgi:hypothetical protein